MLGKVMRWLSVALPFLLVIRGQAMAAETTMPDWLSIHGQATGLVQHHPSFRSPFEGQNSLEGNSQTKETSDATMYLGLRIGDGLEVFINPEIDQGFGLSNTLGLAGFSSGEAYKVGKTNPYFRLQRAFIRYTVGLGGDNTPIEDTANQFGGSRPSNNIVLTAGKISAVDIFDTNIYAHDPRSDFFNWSILDSGAYDYAADAWGYSYGIAAEWTQAWWTARVGLFDLSTIPNTTTLETDFSQFELVSEFEARHDLLAHPGKVKLLVFANRGRMASYRDAVAAAAQFGLVPDVAQVRKYRSRSGMAINVEQGITDDLGAFLKASANDGSKEAFEFTEINRSIAVGVSLKGTSWSRADDTVGVAGVVNDISEAARRYFAAGGLGILIGDGQLPRKGTEDILETYYRASLTKEISATLDYQFVNHPAYDAARGPVQIIGVRLHGGF